MITVPVPTGFTRYTFTEGLSSGSLAFHGFSSPQQAHFSEPFVWVLLVIFCKIPTANLVAHWDWLSGSLTGVITCVRRECSHGNKLSVIPLPIAPGSIPTRELLAPAKAGWLGPAAPSGCSIFPGVPVHLWWNNGVTWSLFWVWWPGGKSWSWCVPLFLSEAHRKFIVTYGSPKSSESFVSKRDKSIIEKIRSLLWPRMSRQGWSVKVLRFSSVSTQMSLPYFWGSCSFPIRVLILVTQG